MNAQAVLARALVADAERWQETAANLRNSDLSVASKSMTEAARALFRAAVAVEAAERSYKLG